MLSESRNNGLNQAKMVDAVPQRIFTFQNAFRGPQSLEITEYKKKKPGSGGPGWAQALSPASNQPSKSG